MTATRLMGDLGTLLLLVVATVVSLSSAAALAQTESSGSLWLGVGAGHSDNIRRSFEMPDSGSFSALTVESDLAYQSRRIEMGLDADLQRRHYSVSNIEDETYGYARFAFEIDALVDRLSWVVRDDYTQGRVDPFQVTSPENRAGLNVFSTGPRLNLPLGTRSLLRMDALKGERSITGFSGLDGGSQDNSIAYVRVLSSTTELAVNLSARELDYDSQAIGLETTRAFLSYSRRLASGEAFLALGSSRTERGTQSSSTPYISLAWSRDVGARSRVEIDAVQQFVDLFNDFRFGSTIDAVLDANIYKQQLVSVAYSVEGVRSTFRADQSLSRAEFELGSARGDYDEAVTSIQYTRSFTEQTTLAISLASVTRDFETAAADDKSVRWNVSLNQGIGRRFSVHLSYESIDDESASGREIDANVVRVFFRYALTDPSIG